MKKNLSKTTGEKCVREKEKDLVRKRQLRACFGRERGSEPVGLY